MPGDSSTALEGAEELRLVAYLDDGSQGPLKSSGSLRRVGTFALEYSSVHLHRTKQKIRHSPKHRDKDPIDCDDLSLLQPKVVVLST